MALIKGMLLSRLLGPTIRGDRPHAAHAWCEKKGLTSLTGKGRPWGGVGLRGHPAWVLLVKLIQQCCSLFLHTHACTDQVNDGEICAPL